MRENHIFDGATVARKNHYMSTSCGVVYIYILLIWEIILISGENETVVDVWACKGAGSVPASKIDISGILLEINNFRGLVGEVS